MKKIKIITFLIIFLLSISALLIYKNIDNSSKIEVRLDKCIDGDTAWFKVDNKIKKYRFLAINSPELDENLGIEAKEYACNILSKAKKIEIEYDKVGEITDKYERELIWVYVDGKLLQELMLDNGYAEIKYIYVKYDYLKKLYKVEYNAKSNKLGIWKNYTDKKYNKYYTIKFKYNKKEKEFKVFQNNTVDLIENPHKNGCKFIGWRTNNYLFDLSTKINKDYDLEAKFEC